MKKNILFVLFAALAGCADTTDSNSEGKKSSSSSLSGTWRVVSFENYDDNSIIFPTEENSGGYDIIITFDVDGDPYQITGRNTTNDVFGTFEYVTSNKVRVSHFSSTKVAQPEIGDEFARALSNDLMEFSIENSRLKLYYENKSRSVTLVPN